MPGRRFEDDPGGVSPPTIIRGRSEKTAATRGGGIGVSDENPQCAGGDPAHRRRYVVGEWGSAPERVYLRSVVGGLVGAVRRLAPTSPLGVRPIPQWWTGFVRMEVLALDVGAVAGALDSLDPEEVARLGPWVSQWPEPEWDYATCQGHEVDYGKMHPVWYGTHTDVEYLEGYEDAFEAKAVLIEALKPWLLDGVLKIVPVCRDRGKGALRIDMRPWGAEKLWLLLTFAARNANVPTFHLC